MRLGVELLGNCLRCPPILSSTPDLPFVYRKLWFCFHWQCQLPTRRGRPYEKKTSSSRRANNANSSLLRIRRWGRIIYRRNFCYIVKAVEYQLVMQNPIIILAKKEPQWKTQVLLILRKLKGKIVGRWCVIERFLSVSLHTKTPYSDRTADGTWLHFP